MTTTQVIGEQPVAVSSPGSTRLIGILAAGAAVAVACGVYGRVHDPTGESVLTLFFKNQITFKSWVATAAVLCVFFQVASALMMWGKIGKGSPSWLGDAHRMSGTIGFILSLPVAYHCLWAIGFTAEVGLTRVFIHSVLGCLFYGAFATKVLVVRTHNLPPMTLPIVGSVVFTLLVGVWLTSAFWFFDTRGLQF